MVRRLVPLALALWAFASPAFAGYPDHPIRLIVPFAAGGGTDVLARIIGKTLHERWGQPVVVENQAGAAGSIGTRAVMKAAPDGYTLLMASTGALMTVSAAAGGDAAFDVNAHLTPIVIGAAPPYVLVVHPSLGIKTTEDLIKLARTKPDGLTFGSSGIGAASHLSGLLFASETGIKLMHVPYKGTGPALSDLLGGRIDMMFAPGPVVSAFVQAGTLRALGVTDTQRSKFYPDVPTLSESGAPGFESVGWFGLLAPPNTPPDIVRQLNEAIVAAMATPAFRDSLANLGAEPRPQTPEEFGRYINGDVAKWSKVVKDNGVQLPGGK